MFVPGSTEHVVHVHQMTVIVYFMLRAARVCLEQNSQHKEIGQSVADGTSHTALWLSASGVQCMGAVLCNASLWLHLLGVWLKVLEKSLL